MKINPIIVIVLAVAVIMTHHANMEIHEYKTKTEICMRYEKNCILEPLN